MCLFCEERWVFGVVLKKLKKGGCLCSIILVILLPFDIDSGIGTINLGFMLLI